MLQAIAQVCSANYSYLIGNVHRRCCRKSTRRFVFLWSLVGCNVLVNVLIVASMGRRISRHIIHVVTRALEYGMMQYLKDSFWKRTIDELQVKMQCCGVYDYKDWYQLSWIEEQQIHLEHQLVKELRLSPSKILLPVVPWSCCNIEYPLQCFHDPFQQMESSYLWKEEPTIVENSLYTKGCLTTLTKPIEEGITGFITITVLIFILMVYDFRKPVCFNLYISDRHDPPIQNSLHILSERRTSTPPDRNCARLDLR
uniref:Tetraspanin n=1 Tax=Photinus pyralis TaxID=7054 RepID=A0A1Y1MW09_PHOPY